VRAEALIANTRVYLIRNNWAGSPEVGRALPLNSHQDGNHSQLISVNDLQGRKLSVGF